MSNQSPKETWKLWADMTEEEKLGLIKRRDEDPDYRKWTNETMTREEKGEMVAVAMRDHYRKIMTDPEYRKEVEEFHKNLEESGLASIMGDGVD